MQKSPVADEKRLIDECFMHRSVTRASCNKNSQPALIFGELITHQLPFIACWVQISSSFLVDKVGLSMMKKWTAPKMLFVGLKNDSTRAHLVCNIQ